MGDGEG
ncbi:Protein of unknown function [Bacillus cereus]|nr:Protein of unknown function [Bacillus cereus]